VRQEAAQRWAESGPLELTWYNLQRRHAAAPCPSPSPAAVGTLPLARRRETLARSLPSGIHLLCCSGPDLDLALKQRASYASAIERPRVRLHASTCRCGCLCPRAHRCAYAPICVGACTRVGLRACMCVCVCMRMQMRVFAHKCMCMSMCMHRECM